MKHAGKPTHKAAWMHRQNKKLELFNMCGIDAQLYMDYGTLLVGQRAWEISTRVFDCVMMEAEVWCAALSGHWVLLAAER